MHLNEVARFAVNEHTAYRQLGFQQGRRLILFPACGYFATSVF